MKLNLKFFFLEKLFVLMLVNCTELVKNSICFHES